MSREEDLVRSTVHAIADSVEDVPPLRLEPSPDGLGSSRPGAGGRPTRSGWSRWQPWVAPLAAAAAVLAIVVVPVILSETPTGSQAGPAVAAGVPPYYVAVEDTTMGLYGLSNNIDQGDRLLVGGTFTGKTLASLPSPQGSTFTSVSAAADDRTFAVLATPLSVGVDLTVRPDKKVLTGTFYELRIAPGTGQPARLTRLPIKPVGHAAGMAISPSGRELAVASYGYTGSSITTANLSVYSTSSGQLLDSWSSRRPVLFTPDGIASPPGYPALTWINGDSAIAFADFATAPTVREIDISTGGDDLLKDSRLIWSPPRHASLDGPCAAEVFPVPANGSEVFCDSTEDLGPAAGYAHRVAWTVYPTADAGRGQAMAVDGSVTVPNTVYTGAPAVGIPLWAGPSGTAVLAQWYTGSTARQLGTVQFGMVSRGRFTPLPSLAGDVILSPVSIAW
jgi:hypothetical protein